jgi:hypothetical protein
MEAVSTLGRKWYEHLHLPDTLKGEHGHKGGIENCLHAKKELSYEFKEAE